MTYSIVAMDPDAGIMGVGVQSHYFSVGSVVPWVKAGKGAVATQAMAETSYGFRGLELMSQGLSAPRALNCLLDEDSFPDTRQVAFLDINGGVEAHTGASCIPEAGHHIGEGFSCQANMMEHDTVWDAMADAFIDSEGDTLDKRILSALKAAEAEGGDIRGKQSSAIVISRIQSSAKPWQDTLMDLRVEDSTRPIDKLDRFIKLHKCYGLADRGEELMGKGEVEEAFRYYELASETCPENHEVMFWRAVTLSQAGEEKEAMNLFRALFLSEPQWRELLMRLTRCGMFEEEMARGMLRRIDEL
ncbi:MAG TPA: DUF1028 domain-containing protein [Candidatus Methanofastidiosa archaeon]|nr:DUF1028 domain-containing protein [Candidatus Methanofastidiosa archaeon]